jgi:hypothetical protein
MYIIIINIIIINHFKYIYIYYDRSEGIICEFGLHLKKCLIYYNLNKLWISFGEYNFFSLIDENAFYITLKENNFSKQKMICFSYQNQKITKFFQLFFYPN